jgi:hypothetical protein
MKDPQHRMRPRSSLFAISPDHHAADARHRADLEASDLYHLLGRNRQALRQALRQVFVGK